MQPEREREIDRCGSAAAVSLSGGMEKGGEGGKEERGERERRRLC